MLKYENSKVFPSTNFIRRVIIVTELLHFSPHKAISLPPEVFYKNRPNTGDELLRKQAINL